MIIQILPYHEPAAAGHCAAGKKAEEIGARGKVITVLVEHTGNLFIVFSKVNKIETERNIFLLFQYLRVIAFRVFLENSDLRKTIYYWRPEGMKCL